MVGMTGNFNWALQMHCSSCQGSHGCAMEHGDFQPFLSPKKTQHIQQESNMAMEILYTSAQIIATSPDVTVKLDLTCWNKVFHVWIALFSTVCSWHWHVEGFTGNFIPLRGCCSPTFRNMVRSILFHFWKGCRAATSHTCSTWFITWPMKTQVHARCFS